MPTSRKTYSLGDRFERFIQGRVRAGRFDSASEVIRAGLRLLEDHESRLEALRAQIAVADAEIAAGQGIRVDDPDAFASDIIKQGQDRLKPRP